MTNPPSEKVHDGDRDAAFSRFYKDSVAHLVGRCILLGVPDPDALGVVQGLMLEMYVRWTEIRSPEAHANFTVACRATDYLKLSSRTLASDDGDLARLGQPLAAGLPDGVLHIEGEQLISARGTVTASSSPARRVRPCARRLQHCRYRSSP
jgi:hypothetical protein